VRRLYSSVKVNQCASIGEENTQAKNANEESRTRPTSIKESSESKVRKKRSDVQKLEENALVVDIRQTQNDLGHSNGLGNRIKRSRTEGSISKQKKKKIKN
jgi:hypothetical protein